MDPLALRVAARFALEKGPTAEEFAEGFFQRHPHLKRFAPNKVLDKATGSGPHPEATQHGENVFLFPKFWKLDPKLQDYVFTHELGHLTLFHYGLAKLIADLEKLGVDPWDRTALPFSESNMDEAFAESFAVHFTTPTELRSRYPEWAQAVQEIAK